MNATARALTARGHALAHVEWRACRLCDHGGQAAGRCRHPSLAHEPSQLVSKLRDHGGACGPEAKFLEFPGLSNER